MNNSIKIKTLKNPLYKSEICTLDTIRATALSSLLEMQQIKLKVPFHGNKNCRNIFYGNKKLKTLIQKENLSSTELNKLNKHIYNDLSNYKKDYSLLSQREIFLKKETKTFGYIFKNHFTNCFGNKTIKFMKANKTHIAITIGGTLLFSSITLYPEAKYQAQASVGVNIGNKYQEVKRVEDLYLNNTESLDYLVSFSHYNFKSFDDLTVDSEFFDKTKGLYTKFMNQTLKFKKDRGGFIMTRDYAQQFLVAEYMYNKGTINYLSSGDKDSAIPIANELNENNSKFIDLYNRINYLSYNVDFSYEKHGVTITLVSKGKNIIIRGLDNFTFN